MAVLKSIRPPSLLPADWKPSRPRSPAKKKSLDRFAPGGRSCAAFRTLYMGITMSLPGSKHGRLPRACRGPRHSKSSGCALPTIACFQFRVSSSLRCGGNSGAQLSWPYAVRETLSEP